MNQNRSLFCLFALAALLTITGCDANIFATSAPEAHLTPVEYLRMAQENPPPRSTEYRLRAAELLIQNSETTIAQQALRDSYKEAPVDSQLKNHIMEARMALLKQDTVKARSYIKNALAILGEAAKGFGTANQIALLLPSKGPHSEAARTIRDGFFAAYYKNAQQGSKNPTIKVYDTGKGDGSEIQAAYQQAMVDQAALIVGPLTKQEVQTMAGIKTNIPVLALNTISDGGLPKNIYQFGLLPEDEIAAVARHAKRKGHSHAIAIAPESEWGQRMVSAFKHHWRENGGNLVEAVFVDPNKDMTSKIQSLLQVKNENRRQDIDMVFLAASNSLARQIKPMLGYYNAGTIPIYSTAAVYGENLASTARDQELNGITFCDMPWIFSSENARTKANSRFYALGIDSFQLASELASQNRLTHSRVSGTTGELYWNGRGQRVQRELVCVKIENGQPVQE